MSEEQKGGDNAAAAEGEQPAAGEGKSIKILNVLALTAESQYEFKSMPRQTFSVKSHSQEDKLIQSVFLKRPLFLLSFLLTFLSIVEGGDAAAAGGGAGGDKEGEKKEDESKYTVIGTSAPKQKKGNNMYSKCSIASLISVSLLSSTDAQNRRKVHQRGQNES